jgi:ribosomal protein L35AE/L33A
MTASQYSEASSRVTYRGTWSRATATSYLGGALRWSSTRGATATFSFTGRGFTWIAAKGPTRGSADVYVNGTHVKTISLYASSVSTRQVVYNRSWSTSATRTVVIRVRGTAGHVRVDLDGLQTLR